jgi:hypothetical protein
MFSLKPFATLPLEMLPQYFEELANYTYIPETKEEVLSIDYFNLKALMYTNIPFFNAAIALLDEEVADMVEKICCWDKKLKKVRTLEDLLNSKHFLDNYENARCEFVTILLEHLPTLA